MKHRYAFQKLLCTYKKCLQKFKLENQRNLTAISSRKRSNLLKRIERLLEKIVRLANGFNYKPAALIAVTAAVLGATDLKAQTFGSLQSNPFNLSIAFNDLVYNTFVDIDGDGDQDMFMMYGSNGGPVYFFENIGTPTAPNFDPPTGSPFGLQNFPDYMAPTFADLDGDGDFDLFMADNNDSEYEYYENTGTPTSPSFGTGIVDPFGLQFFPNFADMNFVDMDGDGDLDLLEGDILGQNLLYYQENIGTTTAPNFANPAFNPWGIVFTHDAPSINVHDLDCDGDFDILGQDYYGEFFYFENTGTATSPAFAPVVNNPFGLAQTTGVYTHFSAVDIDGDGDVDVMSSEYDMFSSGQAHIRFFEQNGLPCISEIADTAFCSGDSLEAPFTLQDDDTLTVTFQINSSNTTLLPTSNITIAGTGYNKFLTAVPATGQSGTSTVEVISSDNISQTDTLSFDLTVHPSPTIASGTSTDDSGSCDGEASVTPSGGATPYSYSWTGGGTTQTITDLCGGNYCVTVTDANGCEADTCINVGSVGLAEVDKQSLIRIFPNPFENEFTILFDQNNTGIELSVFNAIGQQMFAKTLWESSLSISTDTWPKGLYFVTFSSATTNKASYKIIKQ